MKEKIIQNVENWFLQSSEEKKFIRKIFIILWFTILALFLYKIINVVIILLISLFLSILFSPFLNRLNKRKINDLLWIILIFLWLFFVIGLIMFLVIPLIINQGIIWFTWLTNWANNLLEIYNTSWLDWLWLPVIIKDFLKNLDIEQILSLIKDNSSQISSFLWSNIKNVIANWAWIIWSVTSSLFNFVLMFLFTFFIVLERKKTRIIIYSLLPHKLSSYIYENESKVKTILSEWIKWQLIIAVCMFSITLTWLLILKLFWIHINGILTLAIIAWFMEFIPYLWTFISFFLALSISLWSWIDAFIGILIVYLIIQQIEWNFMVPYIMWKTLSLSPLVVLLSMTTWWVLFWIIWVVFTIPVISVIKVFLQPYVDRRRKENHFIK